MSTSDRRNDQYLRNVRHGMRERERENEWFAQESDLPFFRITEPRSSIPEASQHIQRAARTSA